jgi:hypothetical protein
LASARAANERIVERAKQLRFVSRIPLICECDDPDCRDIIPVTLDEYRAIRSNPDRNLLLTGHFTAQRRSF